MSTKRKKVKLIKCGKIEYIFGKTKKSWVVSVFTSKIVFQKTFSNKFARKNWILEHIPHDDNESFSELTQIEQGKYESRLKDFFEKKGEIPFNQH